MRFREFHHRWEWRMRASPEALWPFVADTNRFDRDAGLPPVEFRGADGSRPRNGRRRMGLSRLGIQLEWVEYPFEWICPSSFSILRRYTKGPIQEMRAVVELAPLPGGGTHLVYQVWTRPRNVLGLIAIPLEVGLRIAKRVEATVRRYDESAFNGKSPAAVPAPSGHRVRLAPGGAARVAALRGALLERGAPADLVAQLVQTLEQGDDLTLARLRPYALADHWGVARRSVLELCLLATRVGLLDLRWDQVCPHCRGAKHSSPSLTEIQPQVTCDFCNIEFGVNFDRFVELTFRPTPAVRQIDTREYCIGSPQHTPHIVAQQLLPPGTCRSLAPSLRSDRYRLRALDLPDGQSLQVAADGLPEATLRVSADGWPREELCLAPTPTLTLENATEREQLLILEHLAWSDQAATAAEVTTLQRFRDLFASEVLRPGLQVSVGSLAVVFTDLRGSTRLYREIGDGPAFSRVMDHFEVLREAIDARDGGVVKTIGDAVMAVFRRPAAALGAIREAQQVLASPSRGERPLRLKAGIHYGPCIAVNLNDRLDYFGATINIAARLVDLSSGENVVISPAVHDDPEVAEYLELARGTLGTERMQATLRGFETERFDLWRVSPLATTASGSDRVG